MGRVAWGVGRVVAPPPDPCAVHTGNTYLALVRYGDNSYELCLYTDGTFTELLQSAAPGTFKTASVEAFHAYRAHALGDVVYWSGFSGGKDWINSWNAITGETATLETGGTTFDRTERCSEAPDYEHAWYRHFDGNALRTYEVPLLQDIAVSLASPGAFLAGELDITGYTKGGESLNIVGSYQRLDGTPATGDIDTWALLPTGPVDAAVGTADLNDIGAPGGRVGVGGLSGDAEGVKRVSDAGAIILVSHPDWALPAGSGSTVRVNPAGTHWSQITGSAGDRKLIRGTVAVAPEECSTTPLIDLDLAPGGEFPEVMLPRD